MLRYEKGRVTALCHEQTTPAPADRSLESHVCHGPIREAEVLHDQLLARFEEMPGLEPEDVLVLPGGDVLTAESGPPTCIKRFSATGEFIEVVTVMDSAKGDCVRVTVAQSPDKSRYYMLDTTKDVIRVFASKS